MMPSRRLNRHGRKFRRLVEQGRHGLRRPGKTLRGGRHVHADRRQRLLQVVVQLARDALALVLLDLVLRGYQPAQFGMRVSERLTRLDEFGDIAHHDDDRTTCSSNIVAADSTNRTAPSTRTIFTCVNGAAGAPPRSATIRERTSGIESG